MKGIGHSAKVSDINPMGTDGFEFVEFASAEPAALHEFFASLGFHASAHHKTRDVALYKQGDIQLLVNGDASSFGRRFYEKHGPCACSFGIRVADAEYALERALSLGAEQGESEYSVDGREIPCIVGVGGALLYLVERYGSAGTIYDSDFEFVQDQTEKPEVGLEILDHLTHNVARGNMDHWAGFYERLFNFREIRYFDIEGKLTGLKSRSLTCRPYQKRSPLKHLPSIWLRVGEAGQIKQSSTPAFSPSPERHSPVFSDSGWCCWDQEADPVVNGWYPGGGQRLICWPSLFPGTRFMASAWHSGSKPSSSRKSSKLLPIWGLLITTSFLFP